jgi:hypothetical protein
MKTSSKKSKKNLLALCLSFVMVASGASAFAACDNGKGNDNDSSTDSTTKPSTSVNSDLKITNSDFETFNTNDGLNVIGTSTTSAPGWKKETTASSSPSKAASGIVNVTEWDELTTSKYDGQIANLTEEQAKALFKEEGALSVKDKLEYYEAWKKSNSKDKDKIATKLKDFYEALNISRKDLPMDSEGKPLANPLTHDYSKDAEGKENFGKGNNVLMIHNQYPEVSADDAYKFEKATGTAQKYVSSTTVTVQAGTAATFSVWVKTMDLHIANTEGKIQDAVNAGAFINVTHSVGSKSLPALSIKNINTEDVTKNNGWKQYSFYLKGSAYADTTFTVELGLGMGTTNQLEYVNGYAFFDDLQCQTVSYEKYTALAANVQKTVDFDATEEEKTFATNGDMSLDSFAIDLYRALNAADLLASIKPEDTNPTTTTLNNGEVVTSQKGGNVYENLGDGFDSTNDIHQVFDGVEAIKTASANNEYLQAVYDNYFTYKDEDNKVQVYDFAENDKILMLMSTDGVAYTLNTNSAFKFADYKDANGVAYDYLAVSFFVKTSKIMTDATGAGVTLNDGYNKYPFSSINTSSVAPVQVDLNADDKKDEDVYDGWQQYFFFVENDYENKDLAQFTFTFNLGPTDLDGTEIKNYKSSFAAFTKFEVYPMSKGEYEAASSGSYAQVIAVKGEQEATAAGNEGFDSAVKVPTDALDNGFANPVNYTGVYSNNQTVNVNGTHNNRNNYAYAGLLNKDGFAKYFSNPKDNAVLLVEKLKSVTGKNTADEVWSAMFGYTSGSATQPLFIWNKATAENTLGDNGLLQYAYGYYGSKVSLSANEYKKISLAVKVGVEDKTSTYANKARANIYLIDMDSKNDASALSIGRNLTYWYDDNGNICADEECETIAFNLQSNGLYTINKDWNEYKKLSATDKAAYEGYFANLEAYEKDKNGNLLVAKNGASHDYDSYWNNQGMDGIAFYCKDGKYYAEKDADGNYSVEVKNLFTVTKTAEKTNALLEARYLAEANRELVYTVDYAQSQGEWVNVTFYIHAGEEAKNYRLEVWSGDRNGKGNPVDSYVAFDMNDDAEAEKYFTDYVTQYKENKAKYENDYQAKAFENVFSWYDSDSYLRYNSNLDKNEYGNLYAESYTYSNNESGIAYLQYTKDDEVRIFADYAFEDVTVTPADRNESDDNTSAPEEDNDGAIDSTNFFMLFSSIAIAAVLVFVIAAVAVRKILKKLGKLPVKKSVAPKAKKEKTVKAEKTEKIEEPKATKVKEEPDQDSPYND